MKEEIGPNLARTLAGQYYDPSKNYELLTTEDGFFLASINKETGERVVEKLETEEACNERAPLFKDGEPRRAKRFDWTLFITVLAIVITVFTALGVIIWRSGILTQVQP
jgi:hypothetical protein